MQQYGGGSDDDFEYSEDEEVIQSHMEILTWKQYIQQYRDSLLNTLENHYKNKVTKEFLVERVLKLFPDENFYFFQLKDNPEDQKNEWPQLEALLNDNIKSKRYFIADGLLEPVHLSLKERDILIEGIIQTMKKCEQDIELQEQIFAERMKRRS